MPEKWIKNVTRKATVFPAVGVTQSFSLTAKTFDISFNYTRYIFVDYTWMYLDKENFEISNIFEEKINEDPRYILKIQNKQKKIGEALKLYIKKISNRKYSKKELITEILRYDSKMTEFYGFWWIAIPAGDILERIVKNILKDNNYSLSLGDLIFVRDELELIKEKRLLTKIALDSKKYKKYSDLPQNLKNKFISHAGQFAWINTTYHLGKEMIAEDFFKKAQLDDPLLILNEIKEQKKVERDVLKKIAKYLNKKDQLYIEAMHSIIYLRNYQKETVNECQHKSESFLEQVADMLDVKLEELLSLSPQEVSKYLSSKTVNNKEIEGTYKRRKKAYAVEYKNNKIIVTDKASDIKKYQTIVESGIVKNMKGQLKGSSACQGVARGKVRVVFEKEDIENFVEGEILVAVMTSIDYVQILKKAAAIVTDEGGITCHAAIFSREFNVPCIIGTKAATKTLKNGDMVEVDANLGIVKIL